MLGNEGLIYGAAAANKPPPRLPFCPWPQEKGEMRLWPSFPRGEGPSAVGLQNNSRGRAGQLAGDGPPPPPYCARTPGRGAQMGVQRRKSSLHRCGAQCAEPGKDGIVPQQDSLAERHDFWHPLWDPSKSRSLSFSFSYPETKNYWPISL